MTTWEQHYADEEMCAMGESMILAMEAILEGRTLEQLRRDVYKYTDCGAWVSFRLHDGTMNHCGDSLDGVQLSDVRGWQIGTIVEGVDDLDICEPERDLIAYTNDKQPTEANADFYKDLSVVEQAANDAWQQTHGCDTCKAHWLAEGMDTSSPDFPGYVDTWDECPDCGGDGRVM